MGGSDIDMIDANTEIGDHLESTSRSLDRLLPMGSVTVGAMAS